MKKFITMAVLVLVCTQSQAASLLSKSNKEETGKYHAVCWHTNGDKYIDKNVSDFDTYNNMTYKIINLDDTVEFTNSECNFKEIE